MAITDGLVSYWKYDESASTIASDSYGSNDGTISGTPNWGAGKFSNALDFDGSTNINLIGAEASLTTSNLTVSGWINVEKYSGSYFPSIFGNHSGANGGWTFEFQASNRRVNVYSWTGSSWAVTLHPTDVTDNVWTHAVATYDGTKWRIYLNNSKYTGGNTSLAYAGTEQFTMGRLWFLSGFGRVLNGMMDDCAYWNRALSDAEVEEIYDAGVAGNALQTLFPGVPVITTTALDNGIVGVDYLDVINTDSSIDTWTVAGYDAGITGTSGASSFNLSGAPMYEADYTVTATASNAFGSDTASFPLKILPDATDFGPYTPGILNNGLVPAKEETLLGLGTGASKKRLWLGRKTQAPHEIVKTIIPRDATVGHSASEFCCYSPKHRTFYQSTNTAPAGISEYDDTGQKLYTYQSDTAQARAQTAIYYDEIGDQVLSCSPNEVYSIKPKSGEINLVATPGTTDWDYGSCWHQAKQLLYIWNGDSVYEIDFADPEIPVTAPISGMYQFDVRGGIACSENFLFHAYETLQAPTVDYMSLSMYQIGDVGSGTIHVWDSLTNNIANPDDAYSGWDGRGGLLDSNVVDLKVKGEHLIIVKWDEANDYGVYVKDIKNLDFALSGVNSTPEYWLTMDTTASSPWSTPGFASMDLAKKDITFPGAGEKYEFFTAFDPQTKTLTIEYGVLEATAGLYSMNFDLNYETKSAFAATETGCWYMDYHGSDLVMVGEDFKDSEGNTGGIAEIRNRDEMVDASSYVLNWGTVTKRIEQLSAVNSFGFPELRIQLKNPDNKWDLTNPDGFWNEYNSRTNVGSKMVIELRRQRGDGSWRPWRQILENEMTGSPQIGPSGSVATLKSSPRGYNVLNYNLASDVGVLRAEKKTITAGAFSTSFSPIIDGTVTVLLEKASSGYVARATVKSSATGIFSQKDSVIYTPSTGVFSLEQDDGQDVAWVFYRSPYNQKGGDFLVDRVLDSAQWQRRSVDAPVVTANSTLPRFAINLPVDPDVSDANQINCYCNASEQGQSFFVTAPYIDSGDTYPGTKVYQYFPQSDTLNYHTTLIDSSTDSGAGVVVSLSYNQPLTPDAGIFAGVVYDSANGHSQVFRAAYNGVSDWAISKEDWRPNAGVHFDTYQSYWANTGSVRKPRAFPSYILKKTDASEHLVLPGFIINDIPNDLYHMAPFAWPLSTALDSTAAIVQLSDWSPTDLHHTTALPMSALAFSDNTPPGGVLKDGSNYGIALVTINAAETLCNQYLYNYFSFDSSGIGWSMVNRSVVQLESGVGVNRPSLNAVASNSIGEAFVVNAYGSPLKTRMLHQVSPSSMWIDKTWDAPTSAPFALNIFTDGDGTNVYCVEGSPFGDSTGTGNLTRFPFTPGALPSSALEAQSYEIESDNTSMGGLFLNLGSSFYLTSYPGRDLWSFGATTSPRFPNFDPSCLSFFDALKTLSTDTHSVFYIANDGTIVFTQRGRSNNPSVQHLEDSPNFKCVQFPVPKEMLDDQVKNKINYTWGTFSDQYPQAGDENPSEILYGPRTLDLGFGALSEAGSYDFVRSVARTYFDGLKYPKQRYRIKHPLLEWVDSQNTVTTRMRNRGQPATYAGSCEGYTWNLQQMTQETEVVFETSPDSSTASISKAGGNSIIILDANRGSDVVLTVQNPNGFNAGDFVQIWLNGAYAYTTEISAVAGITVTVDDLLVDVEAIQGVRISTSVNTLAWDVTFGWDFPRWDKA